MSKKLGERISELLIKRGMQQKDLAKILNVTEAVISRYISGDREPKPEMLANIATALHTTSDYLLDIENSEFDFYGIKRMIARNSSNMTNAEKKELLDELFEEDD